jgi:hypothetical protein
MNYGEIKNELLNIVVYLTSAVEAKEDDYTHQPTNDVLKNVLDSANEDISKLKEKIVASEKPKFKVHIKFEGVNDWNNPIYKDVDSNRRYGSTDTLFNWGSTADKVNAYFKEHIDELQYFGKSFDCEPLGGYLKQTELIIIEGK